MDKEKGTFTTPIRATLSNLVLLPVDNEKKDSLIIDPSKDWIGDFCKVLSIGPDVTGIKVGDLVLRPDPADVEWKDESDDVVYLICDEASIVAIKN